MQTVTNGAAQELVAICQKFVVDNRIGCSETIYQTDWVIENAYGLIDEICGIVGFMPMEDDND